MPGGIPVAIAALSSVAGGPRALAEDVLPRLVAIAERGSKTTHDVAAVVSALNTLRVVLCGFGGLFGGPPSQSQSQGSDGRSERPALGVLLPFVGQWHALRACYMASTAG